MKKRINLVITLLFLAIVMGFGTAFWILPDRAFSENENRRLQSLPSVSLSDWLDGSLSARLTRYYSDQFPLRDHLVGLHAVGELLMGRGESNGVLKGRNGQLAVRLFDMMQEDGTVTVNTDLYSPAHVERELQALIRLCDRLGAGEDGTRTGVPVTVLIPPRTIDVAGEAFPYPSDLSDRLHDQITDTLGGGRTSFVDLTDRYRTMYGEGDYVYYRTDHHWTTYGAYIAYRAVLHEWDMDERAVPREAFTVRHVPDFYGTTHSRAGWSGVAADTLEIWEATNGSDRDFTVRDEEGCTVIGQGFIKESYLTGKDKYGAFLDGTHRFLTVTDTGTAKPERPRLLVVKDSFANTMVPFLARHFDLVLVSLPTAPRDESPDLASLADEYGCERILLVCHAENLLTTDCLSRLK